MPTYGKVKVNFLTHDVSGSAVELAVNNIATKASPTFTGTVTVPTPTAGDDSTKAASTAFVVASFATKASPTFTGTVTVPTATAGDSSTKAASTAFVATSFAPKASPAFTGTITGVNLTLSGDLTVNGTTTTIDTTTLQVEDKNIEIGKVSSPSDTTADGGGWTLKGATDKTFNWVNSTDAWTSSEHIHLGDDKKLLIGTGSDIQIYHDGFDSIIKNTTGNLRVVADNIHFEAGDFGDEFLRCNHDGAVELYYDNSKKVSTASFGVQFEEDVQFPSAGDNNALTWDKSEHTLEWRDNVKAAWGDGDDLQIYHNGNHSFLENTTGDLYLRSDDDIFIQVGTGNELAISAENDGAVSLYFDAAKKLETTTNGITVTGNGLFSGNLETSEHLSLTADNKKIKIGAGDDIQIYHDGSNSFLLNNTGNLYIQGDSSSTTEEVLIRPKQGEQSARFIANGAVELYHDNSKKLETTSSGINVLGAINVNGSALSAAPEISSTASGAITADRAVMINSNGTVSQVTGVTASNGSLTNHSQVTGGGSTRQRSASNNNGKFLILENNMNGSNTILYATLATVTGTSVSFSSNTQVTNLLKDSTHQIFDVCYHAADDKFFVVYTDTNDAIVGRVITYSGTSITVGSDSDIYNNNSYPVKEVTCAYDPDQERILTAFSAGSDKRGYCKDVTLSGTTGFAPQTTVAISEGVGGAYTYYVHYPKIHYNTHGNFFYIVWDQDSNHSRMVKVAWGGSNYVTTYDTGGDFSDNKAFKWLAEDYEGQAGLTCIEGTNLAVIVYKTGANNLYAKMCEHNGTTWSAHTATTIVTSGSMVNAIAFDAKNERILCSVQGQSQVGNLVVLSYDTTAKTLTVESTTQIWTTTNMINNACYMSFDSTNNKALASKGMTSTASYNQSIVLQRPSTDLNADKYIGFAKSTVSDGAAVSVKVASNTTTQSSLTPTTKYYVQADGSVGTSAINPSVVAGIALTSTSLLIRS